MMRVFLDANLLFTAARNPGGKAAFVIELGKVGHFQIFTSDVALNEAERNLAAKSPKSIPSFIELVKKITTITADLSADYPESLPAKDAVIFQAAARCRASHLLTGDLRHFGTLMNRQDLPGGVIIQTAAEFLAAQSYPG